MDSKTRAQIVKSLRSAAATLANTSPAEYPKDDVPNKYRGDREAWESAWDERYQKREDNKSWGDVYRAGMREVDLDLSTLDKAKAGKLSAQDVVKLLGLDKGVGVWWALEGLEGNKPMHLYDFAVEEDDAYGSSLAHAYEFDDSDMAYAIEALRTGFWPEASEIGGETEDDDGNWVWVPEPYEGSDLGGGPDAVRIYFPYLLIGERPPGWHPDDGPNKSVSNYRGGNSYIEPSVWPTILVKEVWYPVPGGMAKKPLNKKLKLSRGYGTEYPPPRGW